MRTLTSKVAVTVALFFTVGLSLYLTLTAVSLTPENRDILGQSYLDARWLFIAASAAGILFAAHFRDDNYRTLWLVLLTASSLGRALDLLLVGDPLLPRNLEVRGAAAWALHFGLGIVCALLLTAYSLLNPAADERH